MPLGDVLNLQRGYDITRREQRSGDVPVVSSGGISSYHDEAISSGPGVVIGRKGTLGRTFFLSGPYWPHDTTLWVEDFKGNDERYVYYLLRSIDFKRFDVGSANPTLNRNHVHPLEVALPPIEEQRGIAATLGALDDKIDSNRRTIDLLDQLAFALWRKASSTGSTRTPASELIAAGKLTIGDGYRAKNSELGSNGLPFVRAANLRDGFDLNIADRLGDDGVARAGDKVSRPGDVVFTSKGTVGRFAYVSQATPPMVYSPQLCYWRSLDPDALPPEVLFYWLRGDEALAQLNALKGQTDMADYVSLRDQRGMWMSLPAPTTVHQVTADLAALLQSAGARRSEIGTLTALRDTLLPELLSGRIRVPEAREAV